MDPKNNKAKHSLAWMLATSPVLELRNPTEAVALAKQVVEHDKQISNLWLTLGVAHYRAGDWNACLAAVGTSARLGKGGDSADWFIMAMAQWRLGNAEEARKRYDQAVAWMEKYNPRDDTLLRFRAEAAALLNVKDAPQVKGKEPTPK